MQSWRLYFNAFPDEKTEIHKHYVHLFIHSVIQQLSVSDVRLCAVHWFWNNYTFLVWISECSCVLLRNTVSYFTLSDDLQVHSFCCRWQFNLFLWLSNIPLGFPGGSVIKNPTANTGDTSSMPVLGRSHGEGIGNLLQYSCLGNPMGREDWWAAVHGVTKELDMT